MSWDYEELRGLCQQHGLPDSTLYQNVLQWKLWRAGYHAERAQEVWCELDQIAKEKGSVKVGGEEWQRVEFASTAETEAVAQVLHSMLDILAQILNLTLLNPPLAESSASFYTVKEKLKRANRASQVLTEMETLQDSDAAKYLGAFVNTIKHRHLLDTDFRAEYGNGTRNEQGVRFKAFTRNGDPYTAVWASDIFASYRKSVVEGICAVGSAVNDYLR